MSANEVGIAINNELASHLHKEGIFFLMKGERISIYLLIKA